MRSTKQGRLIICFIAHNTVDKNCYCPPLLYPIMPCATAFIFSSLYLHCLLIYGLLFTISSFMGCPLLAMVISTLYLLVYELLFILLLSMFLSALYLLVYELLFMLLLSMFLSALYLLVSGLLFILLLSMLLSAL